MIYTRPDAMPVRVARLSADIIQDFENEMGPLAKAPVKISDWNSHPATHSEVQDLDPYDTENSSTVPPLTFDLSM